MCQRGDIELQLKKKNLKIFPVHAIKHSRAWVPRRESYGIHLSRGRGAAFPKVHLSRDGGRGCEVVFSLIEDYLLNYSSAVLDYESVGEADLGVQPCDQLA